MSEPETLAAYCVASFENDGLLVRVARPDGLGLSGEHLEERPEEVLKSGELSHGAGGTTAATISPTVLARRCRPVRRVQGSKGARE